MGANMPKRPDELKEIKAIVRRIKKKESGMKKCKGKKK